MRKHDDLDAVVRHALGHALVSGHHAAAKLLVFAFDRQGTATIPHPICKLRWRIPAQPSDEEIQDLFELNRIAIRWIGYEDVTGSLNLVGWVRLNFGRLYGIEWKMLDGLV